MTYVSVDAINVNKTKNSYRDDVVIKNIIELSSSEFNDFTK